MFDFSRTPRYNPPMTVYSYSRINTFFTCPAQFQYRYLLKTPSPLPQGIELFLGSRFHESMEYLYQQVPKRIPTVNEMMDHFKTHWDKHWQTALQKQKEMNFNTPLRIVREGQTVEDYFEKGQLFLENYYHQYHPFDQDQTVGIEMRVAFDLDEKKQYKMQGFIDRLGRDEEGTLWIHDYKTSAQKMSSEDVKSEDQLALYQIGLLQNPKFSAKEKIKLIWHFVAFEKDQVIGERNPKEIEWLKQKYVSKIKTIESAKDFSPKTSALCGWCEYLPICEEGKKAVENRRKKKEESNGSPSTVASAVETPEPMKPAPVEAPVGAAAPAVKPIRNRRSSFKPVNPDQLPLF